MRQRFFEYLRVLQACIEHPSKQRIELQMVVITFVFVIAMLNSFIGIGTVAILVFGYRDAWLPMAHYFFERHGKLFSIYVPMAGFLAVAASIGPIAHDDLLRDIIVGQYYQYDYRNLYPISTLPAFDLWYGFDHALNWFQIALTPIVTMWLLQFLLYSSMTAVVAKAVLQIMGNRRDSIYWAGLAVAIAVYLSVGRIGLARPEIILSVWAISAILVRRNSGVVAWTLAGALLCTSYWLAFLYFAAALLFQTSLTKKIGAVIALAVIHFGFWLLMFGADYFSALLWLPEVLKNQICQVGENINLELLLFNPIVFGLLILGSIGLIVDGSRRALTIAFVLVFFIASNQVRYIGVIAPLMVLLAIQCWKPKLPELNAIGMPLVACISLFVLLQASGTIPSRDDAPDFAIPANSRVITAFGEATYSMPFFNPGIQIEPSYAFGAAPKDVQQLSLDISQNSKINCETIKKYHFTHVVEQSMSGELPSCLTLSAVQKKWRLWNVQ